MDKEELIKEYNTITNSNKDINTIYHILDELGINYKKTKCPKCRKDLQMIAAEELGLIESAADVSEFNGKKENTEYRYLKKSGTWWKHNVYDQNTDPKLIEKFIKVFPTGFYEKIETPTVEDTPTVEENINNEE